MSDRDEHERTAASRPEISDEKIAGLLRMTGPRPPVPGDRTARVKAAVRARWLSERRGSTRRRAWMVAALGAAAALAVVVGREWRSRPGTPAAQDRMPRVEAVYGPASIRPASDSPAQQDGSGPPGEIRPGHVVPAGSWLETGGDGRLALRLSSGASLRLDVGTRLEVWSDRSVTLAAGAVYVDSGGRGDALEPGDASIEIRTRAGYVREIGTQFEVRIIEAAVRVRVREGLVTVDRPAGRLDVRSGRELRMDGDGGTSSRDVPTYGEEWAWVGAIAPMMDTEGRSLREFLDWMARERGLGVQFADGHIEDTATIRLNGSIQGMTLDQALESVLLTCRLRYRIAGDLLVVEGLDSPAGTP